MANQFICSQPDFNRFLKAVTRGGIPDRVPFFEIHGQLDQKVLDYIKGQDPSFEWVCPIDSAFGEEDAELRRHISYMYALGYDYCTVIPSFEFKKSLRTSASTNRSFLMAEGAMIRDRGDFSRYLWPDASGDCYAQIESAKKYLPEGMKVVAYSRGPHLASLYLLGYEGICYLLEDDEKLVRDVINTAGERILELYARCARYDQVGALGIGDDLGFYNATYLSPETMRGLTGMGFPQPIGAKSIIKAPKRSI